MTLLQMHLLVYTGTVRHVSIQKNVRGTWTRNLLHTVRRILPCTTGVLWNVDQSFLSIYRYLHYLCTWCLMPYLRRRSGSCMLDTQHVAVKRPTLYTAESLGYMLLARPICELSVLEQWRAPANAMRRLCEMWVVQAKCSNCAWFLNFWRPG